MNALVWWLGLARPSGLGWWVGLAGPYVARENAQEYAEMLVEYSEPYLCDLRGDPVSVN